MIAIPIMLSTAAVRANTIAMEVTTLNVFVAMLIIIKIKKLLSSQKYKKHFVFQSILNLAATLLLYVLARSIQTAKK